MNRLELLAPAKNLESGKAAINHGADAVYIGAPKFSARVAAGNALSDIAKLIQYAHRYWARVYIALNTILYDKELNEAQTMIRNLYESGADALIIQDMGLLELDLPPLPLFASTQAHNYSLERIQFLENVGFQRVILARELSLKDVKEIRKNTTIELEYFIHGALCVSFSGQCYLSQATQGRSANRGECAQPCRLPYTLIDNNGKVIANNKYLLSLRDLNLSEYLQDLIQAGISSFKIEGRLKDINYVKNITAFYRKKIDEILEHHSSYSRASSGQTQIAFQPDPSKTFNRGFTDHLIRRRNKDSISLHTPKSIGAKLGVVSRMKKNQLTLETEETPQNGDGICFFDEQNVLCGTNINTVDGKNIYPAEMKGIKVGTVLYRNYDRKFAKILEQEKTKRIIRVDMIFKENSDGFSLDVEDEDRISVSAAVQTEKNPAKNSDVAQTSIKRQLEKLGNSIFSLRNFRIQWKQPYFIPMSLCNDLRRKAIALLEEERMKKYPQQLVSTARNRIPYPFKELDYSANVANKLAEAFYRRHGVERIEPAYELIKVHDANVMTTKHCLRFQYGLCSGKGNTQPAPFLLQDGRNTYRLEFDCIACQMKIIIGNKRV